MAWYPAGTLTYRRRKAFSIVTDSTATSRDVELVIPSGWDEFWAAADASGHGVRFTASDGVTPIVYQQKSGTWDLANRTATFELQGVTTPASADRCVLLYVYFAPSGGSAVDGAGSFTASGPLDADMELGKPDPNSAIPVRPQTPSESQPGFRIAKGSSEIRDVFFDLTDILQPAAGRYNGHRQWEEPGIADVDVLDSGGSSAAVMNEPAAMRWVSVDVGGGSQNQRLYLRARVKSGVTANKYTLAANILTATPLSTPTYRNLAARLGVQVKDQLEA